MKIPAPCPVCFLEQQQQQSGGRAGFVLLPGRMTDEGHVLVRCSKGHEGAIIYDERRHGLLLESACHALFDRYEREAVSGFAAALERAHEFFVRVICRSRKMPAETFDRAWRQMAKQSERQLGCFMLAYALETGTPYQVDPKMVEFRNRVIHQGYIPSAAEAENFGSYVFADILGMTRFLTDHHKEAMEAEIKAETAERVAKLPPGSRPPLIMKVTPAYVDRASNEARDITDFAGFLKAMGDKWPRKKDPELRTDGQFK